MINLDWRTGEERNFISNTIGEQAGVVVEHGTSLPEVLGSNVADPPDLVLSNVKKDPRPEPSFLRQKQNGRLIQIHFLKSLVRVYKCTTAGLYSVEDVYFSIRQWYLFKLSVRKKLVKGAS